MPINTRTLLIPLLLTGCASAPDAETGQALDLATTGAALGSGMVESNPLMAGTLTTPVGWAGAAVVKVGVPVMAKHLPEDACRKVRAGFGGAGYGAAAWNLALLAGAPTGVGLPVALGAYAVSHQALYKTDACGNPPTYVTAGDVEIGDEIYHWDGTKILPWSPVARIEALPENRLRLVADDGWLVEYDNDSVVAVR